MRVVVTGATGLVAGSIVRELVRRGHDVIGTTRRPETQERIERLGASALVVQPTGPTSLASVVANADGLIHVAGIRNTSFVANAGLDRLRRVVAISSAAIGSRSHRSAAQYRAGEEAMRRAHARTLFVRPTMIYGSMRDHNVHHVINAARRWRVLPLPDGGRALIQPIHYSDLAVATVSLFESDASGVVAAGGPGPITTRAAARAIFRALGLTERLIPLPVAAALPVARMIDRVRGSRLVEMLERTREDRVVDNARLSELTNIRLRSFDEGVGAEVAEMEHGA